METMILSGEEAIIRGAEILRSGGLVAFPTETVYGLGGNALNSDTVRKIYSAKGRPSDNPLIVHVSRIEDIAPLVKEFSKLNRAVAEAFMPGPITLIFPRGAAVPTEVTAGLDTVAIRIPGKKIARDLIDAAGLPVAAPSANRSTHISPTSARHVYEDLNGKIPLIIDGGDSDVGIESTVLDLTGEIPTVLRPGAITDDMLLTVLDRVKSFDGKVISAAPAPGMKYRHYAPRVGMAISNDVTKLKAQYEELKREGVNPVLVAPDDIIKEVHADNFISLGENTVTACRRIFGALRDAEKDFGYILCYDFERKGLGASIMNRVEKAAGGNVL